MNLLNALSLPNTGRTENILGIAHTFRLEESASGGALAAIEINVPPGLGIPPHTHTQEDELFFVLDGAVEFAGDDLPGPVTVPKGGLFYGPRGRLHSFRNPTDAPSRFLVIVTPGGGVTGMFADLAALSAPTPESVQEICTRYGCTFAPPPG